jgi:hypothetical protein
MIGSSRDGPNCRPVAGLALISVKSLVIPDAQLRI